MNRFPTDFLTSDLLALSAFSEKIDAVMNGSGNFEQADSWGHPDLPRYLPWMGSRHRFVGHNVPLSVFRGEGLALFLLARLSQPRVIVECFTGTGYTAAWLAAGCPHASIYTVDNFCEGNIGGEGYSAVQDLLHQLELTNVTSLYGSIEQLRSSLEGRIVDLLFADGAYGEVAGLDLSEDVIVIRHDDMNGQDLKRSFSIFGGSNLSVMCPTVEERDILMTLMGKAFPVGRSDV